MIINAAWSTKRTAKNGRCIVSCERKGYYWGQFWIAQIRGLDKKWGIDREFVSGNTHTRTLDAGVYDIFRSPRKNASQYERYFVVVRDDGSSEEVDRQYVQQYAEDIQRHIDNTTDKSQLCFSPAPF